MIGIYIGSMEGGGAERVVLNLANEFDKRNIPVLLILRFKRGAYLKKLNSSIKVVELSGNNPFVLILRIIRVCKFNNVTSLLSVCRYNNVLTLIANIFLRIRLVVREANTFDSIFNSKWNISRVKNSFLYHLMKRLYPKADKVIANSIDTANDILTNININRKKVVVINNPLVSNEIIELSREPIDPTFLDTSKPRIISVGRLVFQKNFEHLIKSFALVKKKLPSASLIILGKGPEKENLRRLSQVLGLEESVHLLGFVDNPYKYLKSADVFAMSSRFEGFGNVLVEALAVGLPIVSTNCPGGPREILDNGKYGKLIPLNDKNAMADSIIETTRNKPQKRILKDRANCFSVSKIAGEYLEVLEAK